jgi:hypothetical protein
MDNEQGTRRASGELFDTLRYAASGEAHLGLFLVSSQRGVDLDDVAFGF